MQDSCWGLQRRSMFPILVPSALTGRPGLNKLRMSLVDARSRATRRGRQHGTSAFPYIEAWITSKPASTAASSEPGSEISSLVDSGDDFNGRLVTSTTGPLVEDLVVQNSNGVNTSMAGTALPSTITALPLSGAALPMTASTVQSIVVPLSVQDMPIVVGSSYMPLISMTQITQAAGPLINMSHAAMQPAAMQPTAMQPTAMPLLGTPSIMSVRPNQIYYLTGALSTFNAQGTQFPYMPNPSWEFSQREKILQNQLLQERQQFEAWKARHAQPQVPRIQDFPVVSSGPAVSEKVKVDDDVEVISVRSASAKRARPRDQASTNVSKLARSNASTSRRSLSPRRDYPRGTITVMRPSQASPKHAEDRPVHGQDLKVFKADMTSMLADMLQSSFSNFAS